MKGEDVQTYAEALHKIDALQAEVNRLRGLQQQAQRLFEESLREKRKAVNDLKAIRARISAVVAHYQKEAKMNSEACIKCSAVAVDLERTRDGTGVPAELLEGPPN